MVPWRGNMSEGHWIVLDSHQYLNNLLSHVSHDERLDVLFRRIFSTALGKMMRYAACTHGIHLMSNVISRSDGAVETLELDYLYLTPSDQPYLLRALHTRQPSSDKTMNDDGLPRYVRKRIQDRMTATGVIHNLTEKLK